MEGFTSSPALWDFPLRRREARDLSVKSSIQDKATKIQKYICKMAPNGEQVSECLRWQKAKGREEEEESSWQEKPLHGKYHQQIEKVAVVKNT